MSDYHRFRQRFAEELDQRYFPIKWLDWAINTQLVTGFYGRESALLTEMKRYPGGAWVAGVFHATGSKDEIMNDLRPQAEAWAKQNGAIEIVVEGRRGWLRELSKHGYRHEKTAVAKGL